ncbi:alpha/beta hydrolase [Streptococcus hillyeri]|uniref:alpha/beta hydrolase n=1 Tax=Streptococcus hillyeri TaxID=2282420 RepID=UPI001FEB453D|nr:alpha/beta hydrolase [Streptococcus hillyeri]
MIITHGFRSNRNGAIKYVDSYHKLGYHVIIYDVRGHGENQPTPVSLGRLESEDLLALIHYTYQTFGETISLGLHGESMGSAISLSVLDKHPKLDFVVADCGFTNLYDLIEGAYGDNHLGFLVYGVNAVTKWGFGINMKETSPIEAIKTNQVPILFIHGEKDNFIKPENSQKLFEANASKDQLVIVPKAEHASSREILGKEAYTKLIENFINGLK